MLKGWTERPLAVWITIGMALAVTPLVVSAVVVHAILNGTAIAAFDDVAARYRSQMGPIHRLQIALWEAAAPVDEYLDAREPTQPAAYRALRVRVEIEFSRLDRELASDRRLQTLLRRAQSDWQEADHIAAELLAHPGALGNAHDIELSDRFGGWIGQAVDKLHAVEGNVAEDLEIDHRAALASYERAKWVSGIAAAASALGILFGAAVIVRILSSSVSRLVDGAQRFAAGDRKHRIEVSVPPELRAVANEFNRMIERIHETEEALAEQARRDVITGLANRRAFEEAAAASFARMRRLNEPFALLMLDIDHFKKVNDTHGHAAGDAVLGIVGQTIKSEIREVDQAFRIGGEEFAVLLAATGIEGAVVAAERLRRSVAAAPAIVEGRPIAVTASIGLAQAAGTQPLSDLVRAADRAMYAAKSGGRNRVVTSNVLEERRLESETPQA